MTIGAVIEGLIDLKRKENIYYPDDIAINNACNILEQLPRTQKVEEWIKNIKDKY